MRKHFDKGSVIIIFATTLLFLIALLEKGFTHDILLEAGVLLVSIKLIIMAYKNSIHNETILKNLEEIKSLLQTKE